MQSPDPQRRFSWIIVFLVIWLIIALTVSAGSALMHAPVPPPVIAFSLTGVILLTLCWSPVSRENVLQLGPSLLVCFHLIRLFVGIYFLILCQRSVLPSEFATPAGWGDILVGVGAILVLWLCVPVRTVARRNGLMAWNVIGLVDILFVLGNGIRLLASDSDLAVPFTTFPLALLPTFVVPLVLISHVVLFTWYWRANISATDV